MTTQTAKKWTEDAVATLLATVGDVRPVPANVVEQAATTLGVTARSVAAKLRNLEIEVASMAKDTAPTFSQVEGEQLAAFVSNNAGTMTYAEIAAAFLDGKFTAKQVQGKILALELTGSVKASEKVEVARTYSEAEEAKFIALANSGAFIEDIATQLGKTVNSVRGKALSLFRAEQITGIPKQKESHAKADADVIDALGSAISEMTVEAIAKATDKTVRGIKTALTRRGIKVADYDGAAKRAKADEKATA